MILFLSLHIYKNGEALYEMTLDTEQNSCIENFSLEEVEEQIDLLETMVDDTRKYYPSYDVASLACMLEQYHLTKLDFPVPFEASTMPDGIYVSTEPLEILSEKQLKKFMTHEFCHTLTNGCPNKDIYNYDNKCRFRFFREIYAELYSRDVVEQEQISYFECDEILDCLQLALGLSDDYKIDGFLRDMLYHDFISFIKRFPVYGDKDAFFLENFQMLQSIDILLGMDSSGYFDRLEEKGLDVEKGNSVLKNEVMVHLSKIFYNNLIIMNETHFNDMTLEDNFYFMYLFRQYMDNMELAIRNSEEMSFEDICRVDAICKERTILFDYLSSKYEVPKENVMMQYAYFDSEQLEYYELPSFMSNEKKEYYQALINERNRSIYDPHNIPLQKGNVYDFSYNSLTKSKK